MSVVVPTYHEVENLRPLVMGVSAAMLKAKRPYEIIVVDDDSRDGTNQAISELNDHGYPIRLITRVGERGLGSAVIRGFSEANGETLVCIDADLSHPPEAIVTILECLANRVSILSSAAVMFWGAAQTSNGVYGVGSIVR